MKTLTLISLASLSVSLMACSSVIEGHAQQIQINTSPPGATCQLNRMGEVIGTVGPTPSALMIEKTKYDLTIKCTKQGYEEGTYLNHSGAAAATVGNILFGTLGPIGWGIDSASGADNKYDTPVNITLPKK